jgi:hypothetical protein
VRRLAWLKHPYPVGPLYGRIHDEKRSSRETCGLGVKIDQPTIDERLGAVAEKNLFLGVKKRVDTELCQNLGFKKQTNAHNIVLIMRL